MVEARERSGALITADMALEQGRDVMVVPGEITSALSAGTNGLLRQGAAPVTRSSDVLEALGLEAAAPDPPTLAAGPSAVLAALAGGPRTIDELVGLAGLGASAVSAALTALELDGLVLTGEGRFRSTIAR